MSDGNSSSDEELVVGHLFGDLFDDLFDESRSDSSDDSSNDESSDDSSDESSSDDSRGSIVSFRFQQGSQQLASDPRYFWSDAVTSVKAP